MKLRRGAFFDRDGVVNVTPGSGYVGRWENFVFTEGIADAIRECREGGLVPVLITNQRGVFTGETVDLEGIHRRMQAVLGESGAQFEAIYAATGDRDDPRRKPQPAMFFEAASDLGIDLKTSLMVGDSRGDILAADAAGLPVTIQLLGTKDPCADATHQVADVPALRELLGELSGAEGPL